MIYYGFNNIIASQSKHMFLNFLLIHNKLVDTKDRICRFYRGGFFRDGFRFRFFFSKTASLQEAGRMPPLIHLLNTTIEIPSEILLLMHVNLNNYLSFSLGIKKDKVAW